MINGRSINTLNINTSLRNLNRFKSQVIGRDAPVERSVLLAFEGPLMRPAVQMTVDADINSRCLDDLGELGLAIQGIERRIVEHQEPLLRVLGIFFFERVDT